MFSGRSIIKTALLLTIFVSSLSNSFAQDPKPNPSQTPKSAKEVVNESENDVLKIETNLIQTGITVLDKKGQFVENLKQEDFEIKVGGKPVQISFFDAFINGKGIKKEKNSDADELNKTSVSESLGRTILFVLDDLHLSLEGINQTKRFLFKFIENDMQSNDLVAIISSSGKLGFLQQFSKDKIMLRETVEKLIFSKPIVALDMTPPQISEYEALMIERLDDGLADVLAMELMRETPGMKIGNAKEQIRSRARNILYQSRLVNQRTLNALEQSIKKSAILPGRKIVMFLSDGFLIDENSDTSLRLQRITDAASRSNSVVNSFDVKGLDFELPKVPESPDSISKVMTIKYMTQAGERTELQNPLNLLAENTGGRFIRNRNDVGAAAGEVIVDASSYYLLAWEPEQINSPQDKLIKIELGVKNRPDLKVKFHKGYFSQPISAQNEPNKAINQSPENIVESQLNSALISQVERRELPTFMTANYMEVPNQGAALSIALKIKSKSLEFVEEKDKMSADVDFLGVIYNSEGKKEASFRDRLTAKFNKQNKKEILPDIFHNFQTNNLKPGLYQIRVATRDTKSGSVGSAIQWIKIPDLSKRKLALSSLIVSENLNAAKVSISKESSPNKTEVNVDGRFSKSSNLRYMFFIYNAKKGNGENITPEVTLQTKLYRGKTEIMNEKPFKLNTDGQDTERLFYAAEIPLSSLTLGTYEIEVILEDKISNESSSQKVKFEVVQ